ncbi:MAG: type I methionyl aminopeptidase [Anaerolineae bacterium]|nr:type I methionyl aminopeptidase [Anaerolineae bacterium]
MSILKPEQYDDLRRSGQINAQILAALRDAVRPGIKTRELDTLACEMQREMGAESSFLGYTFDLNKQPAYPATINVSVNEELVHGIPGKRVLKRGDVVTLDCGTRYKGIITDAALTVVVGESGSPRVQQLIQATEEALEVAIALLKPGRRVGDIAFAIQAVLQKYRLGIPPNFGGHGVGLRPHDDPHIPNIGKPGEGDAFQVGQVVAIEPMAMLGRPETRLLRDHWTVVTTDRSICAHTEHTMLIHADGAEVVTRFPNGE